MPDHSIYIFEDAGYESFGPLTEVRAVWDLRCGAFTNVERIRNQLSHVIPDCKFYYQTRSYLAPLYNEVYPQGSVNPSVISGTVIGINGRAIFSYESMRETVSKLLASKEDLVIRKDDKVVGFSIANRNGGVTGRELRDLIAESEHGADKIESSLDVELVKHPWELISLSSEKVFLNDYNFLQVKYIPIDVDTSNKFPIRIDPSVEIGAGAILDALNGPIVIEENVIVEPGVIIQGSCHIGAYSIIRPGARLENVFMGHHCRIGGEVSNTIFQSYSNKQHSGYVGNSYIGSWVNIGAATDTSDLKNNYGMVFVELNGKSVNSGSRHIGSIIGDFVKTAIHTRLNTGTVVGTCCNLFGIDFPPKAVPPFTWVSSEGLQDYRFDKALETIQMQMPRRKRVDRPDLPCELTSGLKSALRHIAESKS